MVSEGLGCGLGPSRCGESTENVGCGIDEEGSAAGKKDGGRDGGRTAGIPCTVEFPNEDTVSVVGGAMVDWRVENAAIEDRLGSSGGGIGRMRGRGRGLVATLSELVWIVELSMDGADGCPGTAVGN